MIKKRLTLLLICAILIGIAKSYAQIELARPINSHDIIEQGIQCHDRESYDSALVYYRQVNVNDPNYSWACYETGLTLYSQNHLEEAEAKAREAISLGFSNPALFTMLGSILDDKGKSAEGAEVIQSVYHKWPYNQNLLYNLGICYINAGKLKEAEAVLLKSARYFPYHTRTHLALGKVNLFMGHTAEAYLAYNMATLMNPKSKYISEFEDALTGKYSNKIDYVGYPYSLQTNAEKWNELRWLLQSELALDKTFDFPFKLDYIVTRQSYLLFQKAAYDPSDTSIYNQLYVRFFKDVVNSNNFENFIYYQFQNTGIVSVNQWLEKNKTTLNQFVNWAVKDIAQWRGHGFELEHANTQNYTVTYRDGDLASMGDYLPGADSLKTGPWIIFNDLGGVSEEGTYTNGKSEGSYKIFYDDGALKQDLNFVDDKLNGKATTYYQDGTRSGDYQFKADKRDGVCTYYNSSGIMYEQDQFLDGKLDGPSIKKDFTNASTTKLEYKAGFAEGPVTSTYMNGKPSEAYAYANDSLVGPYKEYYKNGQIKTEGNYSRGEAVGEWKYYYANGKLKSVGQYSEKGERTGVWKYYNFDGTLESTEDTYIDGMLTGVRIEYFPNGLKKDIYTYKDNLPTAETIFNLSGKEVEKADSTNNTFISKDYYSNGVLRIEGGMKNGKRNGLWRTYNANGILTSELTYVDDDLSGPQKTYYLSGTVHEEYYCDSNKINGLYKEYHKNGTLKSQSWFINDLQQGEYFNYFKNGKVQDSGFLNEGKHVGTVTLFNYDGTLNEQLTYNDEGILVGIKQFDTKGNPLDSVQLKNGNGQYRHYYENGQLSSVGTYVMGHLNDSLTIYYPNGKVQSKGFYIYGMANGTVKRWDTKGRIDLEKSYLLGNDEGTYRGYNDGVLYYEGNYINDEECGISKIYHPNGKIYKENEWQNGERTGYSSLYSPDGILMYRLQYIKGAVVGFSYLGKDGKMVKEIPTSNYTGLLVAYYPSGVVSARINLKNGTFNGMKTEYYASGKKFRETEFLFNDYHGLDKHYFPNGNLSEQAHYDYDEQNDSYKSFYENGKVKKEGTYYMDDKVGWWKTYDSTGKLTEEAKYQDGVIVELKTSK